MSDPRDVLLRECAQVFRSLRYLPGELPERFHAGHLYERFTLLAKRCEELAPRREETT